MAMRMQELAARSGLPRTTIHHYVREGLLPAAHKTAPNAAEYDDDHLSRLRLITRLRDEEAGALSIPEIRRVLELLDGDMELRSAVRLVREEISPGDVTDAWSDPGEFAVVADCATTFVGELEGAGLLEKRDGRFSPGDLLVARACHAICDGGDIDPADLTPLADLLREVGHYSDTLIEVQGVRSAGGGNGAGRSGEAGTLGRDLSGLCEALLWRCFEASGPTPGRND